MQGIHERLGKAGRAQVDRVGEATGGWLSILGILLDQDSAGGKGVEEGFLQMVQDPLAALPLVRKGAFADMIGQAKVPPESAILAAGALIAQTLRFGIAVEAGRRSRRLLETTQALAEAVRGQGVWPYLMEVSDRLRRTASGEIAFRTQPECRLREEAVERIILTPSLVATRRLTFWRNGPALVFFIAEGAPSAPHDPPDGLLLTALAVGDRTRLRMLRHLAQGACTNLEMAEFLGLNPSTVSRHFKVFKDAGFVELHEGPDGRAEYEFTPEALAAAFGAISDFIQGKE
jgi:DNA-binding transcriptional ArsR family regulator